ncbi:MAG: U32 family peptidase [Deltaproteobacteria bacterium]|nr:U32 family peptidase [Deltaproteobacteria bacterium]
MKNIPELLAPAGDLEKLDTALHFGADAVYLGGEKFSLRAAAGNFSFKDLARAREVTRKYAKKLYLTLNAYLHQKDISAFRNFLKELMPLDMDAYIVSDPGALALIRDIDPDRPLHLSTQTNTTNAAAANFWREMGIHRINLARELSLDEIREIRTASPLELEVFIHGAMCVAYSGRCLLSAALTGRSANQGACTHPCRWKYALVEETRPDEYLPLEEDAGGTYIMNSRDLCLIDHIPELVSAGVNSLKIEGRMKSRYYLAVVTSVYRHALDTFLSSPQSYRCDPLWKKELEKVSHRPYGTGFLFSPENQGIQPQNSNYIRTHEFIGVLLENPDGQILVQVRNRFFPGDTLENVSPRMQRTAFHAASLRRHDGTALEVAQPNDLVLMDLPPSARPGDLLRREKPPAST